MRLLYLATRDCWPVISGAHLRDYHLARQIAKNAELTYVAAISGEGASAGRSWWDRSEPLLNSEILRVPRRQGYTPLKLLRGLIGPTPFTVLNYTSTRMMAEVERLLQDRSFDSIQVEGIFLSEYTKRIRKIAPQIPILSDWHNIESEILERFAKHEASATKRFYARRTAALLLHSERQLLRLADTHTVCSERERRRLLELEPAAHIEVLSNGVDVSWFQGFSARSEVRRNLVFVGSMDYHANIDAALYFGREVWPAVRVRRPEIQLLIVGSRPTAEILDLAKQPGISVTGTVDDIRPYYSNALASIVPLRVGGGTRLKVLEAMAAGTPVISTTLGAEGLAVTNGKDILIADSVAAMVDAVSQLEAESDEWHTLAGNARNLVRAHYDWSTIGEKLLRLHAAQVEMRRGSQAAGVMRSGGLGGSEKDENRQRS